MSERNKDGAGKGDRSRVSDQKAYRKGIERIFGYSRTKKGYNEPNKDKKHD